MPVMTVDASMHMPLTATLQPPLSCLAELHSPCRRLVTPACTLIAASVVLLYRFCCVFVAGQQHALCGLTLDGHGRTLPLTFTGRPHSYDITEP